MKMLRFCSFIVGFMAMTLFGQELRPRLRPIIRVGTGSRAYSLKVNEVDCKVTIQGVIAETDMTMTFYNPNDAVLEGMLYFPLPQGATISGYALDIQGKMIDGVAVEKQKARTVFNDIVRQNIDPGLVEWSKGNNFKTKVYPIPAKGIRKVKVRYITTVNYQADQPFFQLPLNFTDKLKKFNLELTVIKPVAPPVVRKSSHSTLTFDKWQDNFMAKATYQDLVMSEDIIVDLPQVETQKLVTAKVDEFCYYAYHDHSVTDTNAPNMKQPETITVLWDASNSREKVDHLREFELIDRISKKNPQAKWHLITFRNTSETVRAFTNSDDLIQHLSTVVYDGATQFGALDKIPQSDLVLLFTDGIQNFGEKLSNFNQPINIFANSSTTDHNYSSFIARKSGGKYFNLKKHSDDVVLKSLTTNPLKLLKVKVTGNNEEHIPTIPQPVIDGVKVTGRLPLASLPAKLTLFYGRNGQISKKVERTISTPNEENESLSIYFAQHKLEELLLDQTGNEDKILQLGQEFQLVTPRTSLLVLDNAQQYIQHKIEPPASMPKWCEIYHKLVNKDAENSKQREKSRLEQVVNEWQEVIKWHKQKFTFTPMQVKEMRKKVSRGMFAAREANEEILDDLDAVDGDDSYDDYGEEDADLDDLDMDLADEGNFEGPSVELEEIVVSLKFNDDGDDEYDDFGDDLGGSQGKSKRRRAVPVRKSSIKIKEWNPNRPYLTALKAAGDNVYSVYIQQKKEYGLNPGFYLDCSKFFLQQKQPKLALRILSNIAEIELENYDLTRILAIRLTELKEHALAITLFREIAKERAELPQANRDLALALAETGAYKEAVELIYKAVLKQSRFRIVKIMLVEMNQIMAEAARKGVTDFDIDPRLKYLVDVDVRVVLTWSVDNSDMDLWVTGPSKEKCLYSHNRTKSGGRLSHDITRGYGPEEFMIRQAHAGDFKVEVNYYGNRSQKKLIPVTLQAKVYTNYGRVNEKVETLVFQLDKNKEVINVGTITFGGDGISQKTSTGYRFYQIKANDTLYNIAKVELGDAKRIIEIYELNPELKKSGVIKVGEVIKLPKK